MKADLRTYGGFASQDEADKGTIGQRLMNKLAECCWIFVPHVNAAGFKLHGGDMNILCPVFLEAATSTCDKMKKRSSLSRAVCLDIRNQLTYWIEQLPPTSTFKLKTQITALRDIIAKHGKYLEKNVPMAETVRNRSVGDKITDSKNYVVTPARDGLLEQLPRFKSKSMI